MNVNSSALEQFSSPITNRIAQNLRIAETKIGEDSASSAQIRFPIDYLSLSITSTNQDRESANIKNINTKIGDIDIAIESIGEQRDIVEKLSEKLDAFQNGDISYTQSMWSEIVKESLKNIESISKNSKNSTDSIGYVENSASVYKTTQMDITLKNSGKAVFEVIEPELQFFRNTAYGNVIMQSSGLEGAKIEIGAEEGKGFGAIADAINSTTDISGVKAQSEVLYKAFDDGTKISEGRTPVEFYINGEKIKPTKVEIGDASGALADSINKISDKTGVSANIGSDGVFSLISDGRAIEIDGDLDALGALGIVDTSLIPDANVQAEATFNPGDTLPEYIYKIDEPVIIKSLSITELDGDFGLYNVYIQNEAEGKNPIKVGNRIEASGNNVYKTNTVEVNGNKLADTIIIRPLDEDGKEGASAGLGGWWYLEDVDVDAEYDVAFIELGKLEIEKSGFSNVLDSKQLTYIYDRGSESLGLEDIGSVDISDSKNIENIARILSATVNEYQSKIDSLKVDRQILGAKEAIIATQDFVENGNSAMYESRDVVVEILMESGKSFIDAQGVRSSEMVSALLFDEFQE